MDRFLHKTQIFYPFCEYFGVIGSNNSVEIYADQFTIGLRNDDTQQFDSKWDGIPMSMKIPVDDILEGLFKLRIRESEKLKTVLELYNMEIQKERLDYRRLKTMEKEVWSKIYETRILGPETEIMKGTPWSRIR